MKGDVIQDAAMRVLDACRLRGLKIATAESCTGGLVSGALTEIAGSSDVLDRGFVTYSNAAKQTMLRVPAEILERYGAVSRETADAMAAGALAMSDADLVVAITGIAGPGGGNTEKPVGLVHFAAATRDGRRVHREERYGDIGRSAVRAQAVAEALAMLELLATNARIQDDGRV
jgi:nicotinamide-nucleotide amidase